MTEAKIIQNPDQLRGESIYDQDGRDVGTINTVYGIGDDAVPMWVTVESSQGVSDKRTLFIPVARIKQEDDRLRVPYSVAHLQEAPEVEEGEEVSEEQERELRDFYAIDLADGEQRTDNISYAAQVPQGDGPARRVDGE
jgi:hypothetical protein